MAAVAGDAVLLVARGALGSSGARSHPCRSRCCVRVDAPRPRCPSRTPNTAGGLGSWTCSRTPSCQPRASWATAAPLRRWFPSSLGRKMANGPTGQGTLAVFHPKLVSRRSVVVLAHTASGARGAGCTHMAWRHNLQSQATLAHPPPGWTKTPLFLELSALKEHRGLL